MNIQSNLENLAGTVVKHLLTNENRMRAFAPVLDTEINPFYKKAAKTLVKAVEFLDLHGNIPTLEQLKVLDITDGLDKQELSQTFDNIIESYDSNWFNAQLDKKYDKLVNDKILTTLVRNNITEMYTGPEDMFNSFEQLKSIYAVHKDGKKSALIVRKANDLIREEGNVEPAKRLFGDFLYENDLTVLFSRTNVGKSILATQIADAVSKGVSVMDECKNECGPKNTLYIDFELSAKRFSHRIGKYELSDNFYRAQASDFTTKEAGFTSYDLFLHTSLEKAIVDNNIGFVVLDNISWVITEMEKSHIIGDFVKKLQRMKKKLGITMLIIAHTPKVDAYKILDINDLAGSAQFGNFLDGIFSIGKDVANNEVRYIKNLKNRETDISDEVVVCNIVKPEDDMVRYIYKEHNYESIMIDQTRINDVRSQVQTEVIDLHKKGLSIRKIAAQLNVSHAKVQRIVTAASKNIELEQIGDTVCSIF